MGFIAMKALSGGLIMNSAAAYAFEAEYDNVLPIWGVQRERELDEFLSYIVCPPKMDDELRAVIEKDRKELDGRLLPWLRLLYAMPGRNRDQQLRAHVTDDPPGSVRCTADPGNAGKDDEDRRLSALRCLHEKMSVSPEYTGTAAEEPEGL